MSFKDVRQYENFLNNSYYYLVLKLELLITEKPHFLLI